MGLSGRRSLKGLGAGSPAAPFPGTSLVFVPAISRPCFHACSCFTLSRLTGPISRLSDSALTYIVARPRAADFISATTLILPESAETIRCHGGYVHSSAAASAGLQSLHLQRSGSWRTTASGAVNGFTRRPGGEKQGWRGSVRRGGWQRMGFEDRSTRESPGLAR